MNGSSKVAVKQFASFNEAMEFSLTLPLNSVLEIKKYDNEIDNTKD